MFVEPEYRGHRIQVAAGERWDAEVRIRRVLTDEKPW